MILDYQIINADNELTQRLILTKSVKNMYCTSHILPPRQLKENQKLK